MFDTCTESPESCQIDVMNGRLFSNGHFKQLPHGQMDRVMG